MAQPKDSKNTKSCVDMALNGWDQKEKPDWIVYITSGYNARILWYHDFSKALITR